MYRRNVNTNNKDTGDLIEGERAKENSVNEDNAVRQGTNNTDL